MVTWWALPLHRVREIWIGGDAALALTIGATTHHLTPEILPVVSLDGRIAIHIERCCCIQGVPVYAMMVIGVRLLHAFENT